MIPPCDPSILENNPQFKRLYENLTTNLLDADGSTRAHSADPNRKAVAEDLKQCQTQRARRRIKERMLRQLAFASNSGLPDECHDNLALISLYLETPRSAIELDIPQDTQGQTHDNALSLLAPEIETFYANISTLIHPLSTLLSTAITELRMISDANTDSGIDLDPEQPTRNPSLRTGHAHARTTSNHYARARARDRRVRTSLAALPSLASQLQERVRTLRRVQLSELPAARRQIAATAAAVLAVKTLLLERTIVILERVKYGTLARATKAKVDHLATVAQGLEGKLEVVKLEIAASLYTPETIAALSRYRQHLLRTREELEDRRQSATKTLKSYGDGDDGETNRSGSDGGTLAQIARRYGSLAREVEEVRMEIARLGE